MKNIIPKLLLLIFSVVLTLVLAETGLWLVERAAQRRHQESRSSRIEALEATYSVRYNSRGYRDIERSYHNKPRKPRIVCLGDSFVVGELVEESDRLTNQLQLQAPNAEVINLGLSGAGPIDYLRIWRKEGIRYQPNVVLTAFYVGNDMYDVLAEARQAGFTVADVERLLAEPTPHLAKRLVQASFPRIYRLLRNFKSRSAKGSAAVAPSLETRIEKLGRNLGVSIDSQEALSRIPDFYVNNARQEKLNPWLLVVGCLVPDYYEESVDPTKPESMQAFDLALELVAQINRECNQVGVDHYLVVVPAAVQLSKETVDHYRKLGYSVDRVYGNFAAQSRIEKFCSARKIHLIDLTPSLQAAAVSPYYEIDGHWTPEGHRIAAEVILKRLQDDGAVAAR